jgi:uncharacterized phage protein (TIGR02218 family)
MKTASNELKTLLNGSQQFAMADLLTITLKSGSVLRYTSADIPLTANNYTFTTFNFKRGKTRLVAGIEVDTLDLTLYGDDSTLIFGQAYPRFAQNGGFDGASVRLERAFMPEWGQPVTGTLWMFSGRIAEVWPSRTTVKVAVKSDLEILNTPMPRNLFQPKCGNMLYDSGCAVSKAAFKVSGTVAAGSTRSAIKSALTQSASWFTGGTITFTSGPNVGVTRTVKTFLAGEFTTAIPLPFAPTVGDTFDALPGCDKALLTCDLKFNNKPRFRGFPYVPVPETAY